MELFKLSQSVPEVGKKGKPPHSSFSESIAKLAGHLTESSGGLAAIADTRRNRHDQPPALYLRCSPDLTSTIRAWCIKIWRLDLAIVLIFSFPSGLFHSSPAVGAFTRYPALIIRPQLYLYETHKMPLTGEEVAKHNSRESCWVIVHVGPRCGDSLAVVNLCRAKHMMLRNSFLVCKHIAPPSPMHRHKLTHVLEHPGGPKIILKYAVSKN